MKTLHKINLRVAIFTQVALGIASVLILANLNGCARVERVPVQVPVEVKVPVMVPCVAASELPPVPIYATANLTGNENLCEQVDALLIERLEQKQFIQKLQAVLAGCIAPADS